MRELDVPNTRMRLSLTVVGPEGAFTSGHGLACLKHLMGRTRWHCIALHCERAERAIETRGLRACETNGPHVERALVHIVNA